MAAHVQFVFVGWAVFSIIASSLGQSVHRKFEYKYSFKGPALIQSDGSIPFWTHGGNAIASDQSIRITPSLRSQKGWVWAKNPMEQPNWEIEVTFRVSGRGRIGADGLAVWFTAKQGIDGPVFGAQDQWNGMGLIFDSFDNDAQQNNPYVMVILNDGSVHYDHESDGQNQQLGGCLRDFRNKPYPIRAKVEYYNKALTVWINNGMTNNKQEYELCLRAENVNLPSSGYFGASAATGGLADDHDVLEFITHSLTQKGGVQQVPENQISAEEKKKFDEEFDEYWKKLQQAEDEYKKEHPDKVTRSPDEDYMTDEDRELRMIFDGQTNIHNTMVQLDRKLDEMMGKQARIESQLYAISSQGGAQPVQGGQPPPQGLPNPDSIRRHEVDTVLNNQRELVQSVRDLRALVGDIQQKSNSIATKVASGGQGGGDAFGGNIILHELRDSVFEMKNNLNARQGQPPNPAVCPPQVMPNCLTPMYFFLFMVAQMAVFIGYFIYKSKQEAAAKKFY